jgi:hypothetical protein
MTDKAGTDVDNTVSRKYNQQKIQSAENTVRENIVSGLNSAAPGKMPTEALDRPSRIFTGVR